MAQLEIDELDVILRENGFTGSDKLNAPVVQSRQPATYRYMESVDKGGPRCHGRH